MKMSGITGSFIVFLMIGMALAQSDNSRWPCRAAGEWCGLVYCCQAESFCTENDGGHRVCIRRGSEIPKCIPGRKPCKKDFNCCAKESCLKTKSGAQVCVSWEEAYYACLPRYAYCRRDNDCCEYEKCSEDWTCRAIKKRATIREE